MDTFNKINLTKEFFFGGNCTFTVESEKSQTWKTFKITRMAPSERFPMPAYAVASLIGPNNETDYAYIGLIDPATGQVKFTKASKRSIASPDVMALTWFMKHLFSDGVLKNAKVHHEGTCGCCGRKLTVPESIERGIGPECWARLHA